MNPARLFLLGIALVALHAADAAFVHVEPGASRAAHLPWAAIALLGAAVVVRWPNELSSGVRGSIAAVVGLLAASDGLQHALHAGQTRGAAGWTGLLMLPAAAALLTSAVWRAAEDTRNRAVVSDGAQARSTKELRRYEAAPRWFIPPNSWVAEQTYKVLEHRDAPESLATLVPRIAPRPLLLTSTGPSYERDVNREWRRLAGPTAQLWELPDTKHTQGLQTHPAQYRQHALSRFDRALLGQREV
jgi:hypothetical protein